MCDCEPSHEHTVGLHTEPVFKVLQPGRVLHFLSGFFVNVRMYKMSGHLLPTLTEMKWNFFNLHLLAAELPLALIQKRLVCSSLIENFLCVFFSFSRSLKSRVRIMVDGTLLITSLIPEDSGNYTCIPTNGLLTPPTASANLTVMRMFLFMVCSRESLWDMRGEMHQTLLIHDWICVHKSCNMHSRSFSWSNFQMSVMGETGACAQASFLLLQSAINRHRNSFKHLLTQQYLTTQWTCSLSMSPVLLEQQGSPNVTEQPSLQATITPGCGSYGAWTTNLSHMPVKHHCRNI